MFIEVNSRALSLFSDYFCTYRLVRWQFIVYLLCINGTRASLIITQNHSSHETTIWLSGAYFFGLSSLLYTFANQSGRNIVYTSAHAYMNARTHTRRQLGKRTYSISSCALAHSRANCRFIPCNRFKHISCHIQSFRKDQSQLGV